MLRSKTREYSSFPFVLGRPGHRNQIVRCHRYRSGHDTTNLPRRVRRGIRVFADRNGWSDQAIGVLAIRQLILIVIDAV